jgi:chorismate mutase / prephenate dehydratase
MRQLRYFKKLIETDVKDLDLGDLRKGINEIDLTILALLRKRRQVVQKVGEFKVQESDDCKQDKSFIRPGREADMMRNLLKENRDVYEPQAVYAIWRSIISSSVNYEQKLTVSVHLPDGDNTNYWLAREHFGTFLKQKIAKTSKSVIDSVLEDKARVGILSLGQKEDKWWRYFSTLVEENGMHVFVSLPFVYNPSHILQTYKTVAIAKIDLEKTTKDVSLLVINLSEGSSWSEVAQKIKDLELNISLIDSEENSYFVKADGFFMGKETIDNKVFVNGLGSLISNVIPIGTYSIPIEVANN